jgi:hypothetical protein
MRWRIDLEHGVEIAALPTQHMQKIRDAQPVGHGKTGVVFLNVHRNTLSAGTVTFEILTASDPNVPDLSTSSYWGTAGTQGVTASQTGLFRFEIGASAATRLGQAIRWKVSGLASGAVHFSMTAFLADT